MGVYIQAHCEELSGRAEISSALTLIQERRNPIGYWTLGEIHDGPIRLYKAVPKNVWMNGAGKEEGTYIDTRMMIG